MNPLKRFTFKVLNRLLYSGRFGDIALRRALIHQLPKTPITYVDVGAYKGDMYDFLDDDLIISKAILIEPQERENQLLQNKYAGIDHIKIIKAVLLDSSREVQFYQNKNAATSSVLAADENLLGKEIDISGERRTYQSQTLDQVTSGFGKIGLLKIDVQGAELEVLKGGENALKETDYIWTEVSFKPLYKGSAIAEDIVAFLESRNFILMNILPGFRSKSGELLQADYLFKKKTI